MPDKKFDLGDYVEVKNRIAILYELYPQARLVTDEVVMLTAPDDKQRVMVKALAYRTPDDPHPGVGYSWMEIPGTTNYTKGSELENTETSAWGRAIASLGILIDKSIASSQEVANKQDDGRPIAPGFVGTAAHPAPDTSRTPEGGMIGTAIAQGNHDFNLRQTPEGWVLPFRVKNGSSSFIVRAEGALAQTLDAIKATVIDQRVTVWGRWSDETTPAKGVKPEIHYRVLHLDRIATPDGILPAPAFDSADDLEQPPDDIELVGEAPTAPLFDDVAVAS
jgi:hypothetical protein